MKIRDITAYLESIASIRLQEPYDNCGLLTGSMDWDVQNVLVCLDVNETVIEEALSKECNLIISHHPLIFNGLKKITGQSYVERTLIQALKHDVAVYAMHTNLDNIITGMNGMLSEKLRLKNLKPLLPVKDILRKLVTFCPEEEAENVRQALFGAGAGHIGNYDCCSFNSKGTGSFRANEKANPYVGIINELHTEPEVRIETIYPVYKEKEVLKALFRTHPYEEVAYDIYPLNNEFNLAGAGAIGELDKETDEMDILDLLKEELNLKYIRHSRLTGRNVLKIAVCTGSGSFLIQDAIQKGAGVFITADMKYHDFQKAEGKILLVDIGHYESECMGKELLFKFLTKKFNTFAVLISETDINPVNYY